MRQFIKDDRGEQIEITNMEDVVEGVRTYPNPLDIIAPRRFGKWPRLTQELMDDVCLKDSLPAGE